MNIVAAKVSYFMMPSTRTKKRSGETVDTKIPIRLGYRVEFDDALVVSVEGKPVKGTGTVVFYSFKHDSITITRPTTANYYKSGSVITDSVGKVQWNAGVKRKSLKLNEFEQKFGEVYVAKVKHGWFLAEVEEESKRAA